ncbi:AI-2E family transporter [Flavobacterium sp.]|uniref:AI-2E family transporter n=1 Tax=Flavobacterium sp. TaxID=239 RepID=UPI002FDB3A4D
MTETVKFPFYIKLAALLLCLIGIITILYLGQDIIFPILLSLLFAIILRPVVKFLIQKLRFPHFIAVVFAIVLFVLIFLGIFYFISLQVSDMANDWGKIKNNFYYHFEHFQQLIRDNFNLSKREQNQIIKNAKIDSLNSGKEIVGSTISSFTDIVLNLTLIPIYTFLFLLYQNLFITFLIKLYKPQHHKKLQEILIEIKVAVQSYVVGLLFEMVAVSVLTTIGLYFIGVQYFILLGIITGILNLVPYIGILFAGALSIVVSLSGSTDLSIIVGVIAVNVVVQLIDNNILVPLFVNSKVQINALVSIVGIIIGNVLGGITGMFLAIPIIAILKVIFDRIEALEPWGYLMGDDLPKTFEWHKIRIPMYNYNNSTTTINFSTDTPEEITPENNNEVNPIDKTDNQKN